MPCQNNIGYILMHHFQCAVYRKFRTSKLTGFEVKTLFAQKLGKFNRTIYVGYLVEVSLNYVKSQVFEGFFARTLG